MQPIKVLILITKSNWGGAQRYVFDLATRLPKDRYAVNVMAGSEGPLTARLIEAGIPASGDLGLGRDVNISGDLAAFWKLVKLLRAEKPDVLHLNSSKIGGLGALAGRLAGVKKIIFTAHGWAFNEDRSFAGKTAIKLAYWLTLVLSHRTIAVSETARKQVVRWPIVGDKIRVIHNGVNFETPYSQANARLELVRMNAQLKAAVKTMGERNIFWVGTIAELHHIKGYEYAIRAVADCVRDIIEKGSKKNIIYAIAGEGEDRARLEGIITELHMEKNIFLLGHVASAAQYLKAFDIFLLASLSEGLGYVLLEAGLASIPIVATTVGGIPEVVEDMGSGILVQPKSSKELAHAISFMMEHPDERKTYGATLNKKVKEHFSVEKMVKETEEVYMEK